MIVMIGADDGKLYKVIKYDSGEQVRIPINKDGSVKWFYDEQLRRNQTDDAESLHKLKSIVKNQINDSIKAACFMTDEEREKTLSVFDEVVQHYTIKLRSGEHPTNLKRVSPLPRQK